MNLCIYMYTWYMYMYELSVWRNYIYLNKIVLNFAFIKNTFQTGHILRHSYYLVSSWFNYTWPFNASLSCLQAAWGKCTLNFACPEWNWPCLCQSGNNQLWAVSETTTPAWFIWQQITVSRPEKLTSWIVLSCLNQNLSIVSSLVYYLSLSVLAER